MGSIGGGAGLFIGYFHLETGREDGTEDGGGGIIKNGPGRDPANDSARRFITHCCALPICTFPPRRGLVSATEGN